MIVGSQSACLLTYHEPSTRINIVEKANAISSDPTKTSVRGKDRVHINDGSHLVHFLRFVVGCLPFSVASLTHVPDDKPAPIFNV